MKDRVTSLALAGILVKNALDVCHSKNFRNVINRRLQLLRRIKGNEVKYIT